MARLASPIENIKDHYTVVVVGSGYGGAIAASRLARAGQRICVLERGREFQPGEYPNTTPQALAEMQSDLPDGHVGSRTGLFDLRVNQDINVFLGCGLGGTSLVNANVSLRAEPRVFENGRWPEALRNDRTTLLEEGYRRAEEMLKPNPYPESSLALPKLQALEKSAGFLNQKFYRPPINVNFTLEGKNHVGVDQHPCVGCGDCVSGCNYAAKNTVLMNYLPDAKNFGAEIYTQAAVRWLERQGDRWLVHYQLVGEGREKFNAPTLTVRADIVVLAAGTLGSTEILLRSKQKGLPLSEKVGDHFTGNGDVLAFGYNTDEDINGIGWGHRPSGEIPPVGPCITGIIDLRNQPTLGDGMVIEEGSVPGGLGSFLPSTLAAAAKLVGKDLRPSMGERIRREGRELESLLRGPYHGAVRNTQTYLVMTHDDGRGRLYLKDDRLRIDWPGVGEQPVFERVNERLSQATQPLGGIFVKNPTWSKLTHHNLVTVHPLGGCVMAEDAERGVVNHKGQVFSSPRGTGAYAGLYVCDGAIVPRSLGVNPLLTISALAERCCALIAKDRGWQVEYRLPSSPAQAAAPEKLGIQFTETMKGYFSTKVKDDYRRGEQQGRADGSPLEFTLTIASEDLDQMLADQMHEGKIVGTVTAPALSGQPLTVTGGTFNLFVVDPSQVATRRMWYKMRMVADDGKAYYFEGFKLIHDDPGFDVWSDTTTLYITVFDGENNQSPILGRGVLIIRPQDFLRQMTTMQVKNARGAAERLEAEARFGRLFMGVLLQTYGKIFRWSSSS